MHSLKQKLKNKYDNIIYRSANLFYPIKVVTTDYRVEKIGNNYSFCMVPENILGHNSIVYSFGAGEDIYSDIELIKKYGCNIKIFDPTPKAISHFEGLMQKTSQRAPYFNDAGLRYDLSEVDVQKIQFEKVALWKENSTLKFFLPQNPTHVSCSINNIQNTDEYIEVKAKKLSTIMKELGHPHIDYLKLDIEGAEFDVLENVIEEYLDVKIIYVEYHYNNINTPFKNIQRIHNSLNNLSLHGFHIIHNNKNRYYTLIKTSPNIV
jgi:FkbM family methyltransferase